MMFSHLAVDIPLNPGFSFPIPFLFIIIPHIITFQTITRLLLLRQLIFRNILFVKTHLIYLPRLFRNTFILPIYRVYLHLFHIIIFHKCKFCKFRIFLILPQDFCLSIVRVFHSYNKYISLKLYKRLVLILPITNI